jgi:zinc-binding alcohol dehydrogenase/oxidoreductase
MTRHHTQAMRAITLHTPGGPEHLIPAEIPRLFYGRWNLLGTNMGSPRGFDALPAHVRQARWRPVVDSVYPLDDAAAAHARLEQPDRFGKVVLECRST